MRPRVFPAEDATQGHDGPGFRPASMRPRVFPAEDSAKPTRYRCPTYCFNEAAGIPRGRLPRLAALVKRTIGSFNEAAGIPRGRPASRRTTMSRRPRRLQ